MIQPLTTPPQWVWVFAHHDPPPTPPNGYASPARPPVVLWL